MKELASYLAENKITFAHNYNEQQALQRIMIPATTPEQLAEIQTICKDNSLSLTVNRGLVIDKVITVKPKTIKK